MAERMRNELLAFLNFEVKRRRDSGRMTGGEDSTTIGLNASASALETATYVAARLVMAFHKTR
jgi:hypothetical protein